MEVVIGSVSDFREWYDVAWEKRDRRMDGWPLMSSPWYTAAICATYVYLVKVAGPAFMKDRKPLNIRTFLIWYNLVQVIFSVYLFTEVSSAVLPMVHLIGFETFFFHSALTVWMGRRLQLPLPTCGLLRQSAS